MQFLMRLRPSNLIIAAALPFIVYLFAFSADYRLSRENNPHSLSKFSVRS